MSVDNLGFLNEISPMFRPYIQSIYQDLKLGNDINSNVQIHNIKVYTKLKFQ